MLATCISLILECRVQSGLMLATCISLILECRIQSGVDACYMY